MLFAFVIDLKKQLKVYLIASSYLLTKRFVLRLVSMVADYIHNYHSLFLPSNVKGTYGLQFLP